eukprot:g27100.t1
MPRLYAKKTNSLAQLESTLKNKGLMEEVQQTIRQTIVSMLSKKGKWITFNTEERKALARLKKDRNIVILPMDKGRMTVFLNRNRYIEKANALLADTDTYQQITIDLTSQLGKRIATNLKKLHNSGDISKTDYQQMKPERSNTARFYRLPKVNKPGVPLRPIVSLP